MGEMGKGNIGMGEEGKYRDGGGEHEKGVRGENIGKGWIRWGRGTWGREI